MKQTENSTGSSFWMHNRILYRDVIKDGRVSRGHDRFGAISNQTRQPSDIRIRCTKNKKSKLQELPRISMIFRVPRSKWYLYPICKRFHLRNVPFNVSIMFTSPAKLLPSTVCSDPSESFGPQWQWNCSSTYLSFGANGPPVSSKNV